MPTGAFYAAKKACQPLHLLYNYADHGIYIVNDRLTTFRNLTAIIRILDINSTEVLSETLDTCAAAESSPKIFELPGLENMTTTYFLDLRLVDEKNIEIVNNFYWLSTKPDVPDYEAKVEPWPYYTPSREFADFTLLNSLRAVKVNLEQCSETIGDKKRISAKLDNLGDHIGFFIELKASAEKTPETILPVFWQDNYISLLPGETRNIEATFSAKHDKPTLTIKGWNLEHPRL
jgi:exo-1,4-beta-D-glucosaminidase